MILITWKDVGDRPDKKLSKSEKPTDKRLNE